MLKIMVGAKETMFEHALKDFPNEACGYLAGREGVARKACPVRNLHASPSSYEMDPREQLTVQKQLRAEGLEQVAIYHSHVATEAYPSRRDIAQATAIQDFFDGHYVLVTLREPGRPIARAFKIRDGHVAEEPIEEVEGNG